MRSILSIDYVIGVVSYYRVRKLTDRQQTDGKTGGKTYEWTGGKTYELTGEKTYKQTGRKTYK